MELMTYNIKYANDQDGENSWPYRKHHLTKQLKFYEPDIIGFQEALMEQVEHFQENLEGYSHVGVNLGQEKIGEEYNPVYYKKDLLELLEENTFWLSETPEKPSKGWDAKFPRVCSYALFKDRKDDRKFWIFNTHFDHQGENARSESSKLVLDKIAAVNAENHPVILMGDLNTTPETQSIQILTEQMNDSRKISKGVKFGPEGTFNKFEPDERVTRRIDFIFTSKENVEVLKYAVLSDLKDFKFPSDHFPVLVEIKFIKNSSFDQSNRG